MASAGNNLSITPAGGTVARTLADRLADGLSVLDFGADPTGLVDSTAAFNIAIAALPNGGIVKIPTGAFLILGVVVVKQNVTIQGPYGGPSIYLSNGASTLPGGGLSTFAQLQIVQSGSVSQVSQAETDISATTCNLTVGDIFSMVAGDTVALKISAYGSTKTMNIPASPTQTWLSGSIIG